MSAQQPSAVENVRRANAKLFCRACKSNKPESDFYKKTGKYRKEYACKKCVNVRRRAHYLENREYKIKQAREYREKNRERVLHSKRRQSFGITAKEFNEMLLRQNGLCAICKQPETSKINRGKNGSKTNSLSVDHDHRTGAIRGLLCGRCNRGVGFFKDDIKILYSAAKYLKESIRSWDKKLNDNNSLLENIFQSQFNMVIPWAVRIHLRMLKTTKHRTLTKASLFMSCKITNWSPSPTCLLNKQKATLNKTGLLVRNY